MKGLNQSQKLIALILLCPLSMVLALGLGGGEWNWVWPFDDDSMLLELRLGRVMLGALVGAALAASGAILQAILRNPLAEPYVLGLSAGAGLGVAFGICSGLTITFFWVAPLFGFVGGMISLFVVYAIARRESETSSYSLILAGVIWGAMCGSLLMLIVARLDNPGLHAIMWWFLGDLQWGDGRQLLVIASVHGLVYALIMIHARKLNALQMGDETARYVGVNAEQLRWIFLALAALLTASAVAVSGLIGFIGLIIPHVMRNQFGTDHRYLIPACILGGAIMLVGMDAMSRLLSYPEEIPAGVFMALLGGPFFLWLLFRGRRVM